MISSERRTVRAEAGATLGDVDRETQVFGLATPLGVVSETGIAGLTLGGGIGWLRRKYGLSSDNNEGEKFIGSKSASTNSSGNVTFTFVPSQAVPAGHKVTATALDVVNGNTSESSAPRTVAAG